MKKEHMKIHMFTLLFSVICLSMYGAWINQYPCAIEQVDGTKILVLLTGDEFHSWYHDENEDSHV